MKGKFVFDENFKIMIGKIDCTEYENKFYIKSITRYRELEKLLRVRGHNPTEFTHLEKRFIDDIRLRRKVSEYLFYIENKIAAEIVGFFLSNEKNINLVFDKSNNKFIQFNKEKPNNKIIKLNLILNSNKIIKITHSCPDKLTFGEKLLLSEILRYYHKILKIPNLFKLSINPKELKIFSSFRNKVVHHEIISLDPGLVDMITMLEKYVTSEYKEKFVDDFGPIKNNMI